MFVWIFFPRWITRVRTRDSTSRDDAVTWLSCHVLDADESRTLCFADGRIGGVARSWWHFVHADAHAAGYICTEFVADSPRVCTYTFSQQSPEVVLLRRANALYPCDRCALGRLFTALRRGTKCTSADDRLIRLITGPWLGGLLPPCDGAGAKIDPREFLCESVVWQLEQTAQWFWRVRWIYHVFPFCDLHIPAIFLKKKQVMIIFSRLFFSPLNAHDEYWPRITLSIWGSDFRNHSVEWRPFKNIFFQERLWISLEQPVKA